MAKLVEYDGNHRRNEGKSTVMSNTEASAFRLLKVSPESCRADIDGAHENARFDEQASEDVLQKAVDSLTAPMPRLREEVGYLWGMRIPKIDELILLPGTYADGGLVCKSIEKMALPALTKTNLAAYFCGHGSVVNAGSLVDVLELLIGEQKNIKANDVAEMINRARKKSRVVPAAKLEHVEDALARLCKEHHMESAMNVIKHVRNSADLTTKIAENYRFDKSASGRFVVDLIRGPYRSWIQPTLLPLEEEIDKATDALRSEPHNEKWLTLLEKKLLEWDEYAQPVQLIDEGKGFDEKRSEEICDKLRNLALHLHNEEDKSEVSLRITRLLNKVFPELPVARETLAQDLESLEKIVSRKQRNARVHENLRNFVNATESAKNDSDKIKYLIDVLSALLRECPDLAESDQLWLHARNSAIDIHNKRRDMISALWLTEKLLSLARKFKAPASICEKLNEDMKFLNRVQQSSKKTTPISPPNSFSPWPLVFIISLVVILIGFNNFVSTSTQKNSTSVAYTAPSTSNYVYVVASKLNVRSSPGGEILGYFEKNHIILAIGYPVNGWQKIVWGEQNEHSGYVWEQYVKIYRN